MWPLLSVNHKQIRLRVDTEGHIFSCKKVIRSCVCQTHKSEVCVCVSEDGLLARGLCTGQHCLGPDISYWLESGSVESRVLFVLPSGFVTSSCAPCTRFSCLFFSQSTYKSELLRIGQHLRHANVNSKVLFTSWAILNGQNKMLLRGGTIIKQARRMANRLGERAGLSGLDICLDLVPVTS